jgi:TolA-binding protein
MKRSERHHLKENEFAHTLARVSEAVTTNSRQITWGIIAAVVIAAAVTGYFLWRARVEGRAGALLAEAMTIAESPVVPPAPPAPPAEPGSSPPTPPAPPAGSYPTEQAKLEAAVPKFLAVAEQYPSTAAGLAGRYHLAASLVELGRRADAEKHYQAVIDKESSGIYGQMARLGLAELQVDGAQYDRAITIYKELTADRDSRLPLDGVLIRLGQAYARAGKTADARQTFTRVVDEFPESQYASQAREELSKLTPTTAGTPGN